MDEQKRPKWKDNGTMFDHLTFEERWLNRLNVSDKARKAFKHRPYQVPGGLSDGRKDNENG
ncbi:MAG: hypothetical protein KBT03_09275 [Bacteroidales bacterium]|nr:hypothetical protein [Candidatus Scybalousia scybalohippi]